MDDTSLQLLLKQMAYPGMPKAESDITRAWIRQHGAGYDKLDFNARLGTGAQIQPGISPATAAQFTQLTKKRADIIAYKADLVDIIEVKPRMSLSAIGQLLGYQHLWELDQFAPRVQNLIAVAQIIDPDVQAVLDANFIVTQQVNPEVLTV